MKLIEWIATGVVLVFAGIGLTLVLVFVAKKIKKAHERKSECEKIQFLLHKNKELKKSNELLLRENAVLSYKMRHEPLIEQLWQTR